MLYATDFIRGLPGYTEKRRPALNPNARVHWSVKARVKRNDRERTYVACLAAGMAGLELANAYVTVRLRFRTGTRRDSDNMTGLIKGVLDGLVDAKVIGDDAPRVIGDPSVVVEVGTPEGYIVEVVSTD